MTRYSWTKITNGRYSIRSRGVIVGRALRDGRFWIAEFHDGREGIGHRMIDAIYDAHSEEV